MRPVPKARHLIALIVFAAVSAVGGLLATGETRLTDRQVGMATGAVRYVHDDLFGRDAVFGDSGLWRQDNPVWQWYLREAYRATGREDVVWAFAMAIAPLVFVYLVGMYLVLWRQCRSWSVACYTAVLSTAVIHLADGTHWGLGPLATMTPSTVALAFVPLLVWAFLSSRNSPMVLWVFLGAGLLANVHAVTGMNLAGVLALGLIVEGRGSARSWLTAAAGLACAVGAASPIVLYQAAQQVRISGGGAWDHWAAVLIVESDPSRQSVATVVARALELPSLGYMLALWLPALAVLLRAERYRVRELGVWVGMLAGALGVGVVLNAAATLAGATAGGPSPFAAFTQALRLTLLPLYVLLAQGAVHLLRSGASRGVLRAALTALLVVWFAPADNLTVARDAVEEYLSRSRSPDQWSLALQTRMDRQAGSEELRALCDWLAARTPIDTVVAGVDGRIRLWARRALVAAEADEPYFQAVGAERRDAWLARLIRQGRALRPAQGGPADPDALDSFAERYGAAYVILTAQAAPPDAAADAWATDPTRRWGAHWKLFRPGAVAATGPATTAPPRRPPDG